VDRIDAKLLGLLQENGSLTASDLAERVALSKAPCWRRVRHLESSGIIRKTVALLDAKHLNVPTTVFVAIKTSNHSAIWSEQLIRVLYGIPEVMEIYRMSGDTDYLIKVVLPDIAAYDVVYKQLISQVTCLDVSASFALETIKHTTSLPLDYIK
jgi:Lrp/AsnC family transcriptional regulator